MNANSILIVDDEIQIRRLLRVVLENQGYHVLDSETGHEGLVQTAQRKPDLVLLDLGLPDIDGLTVAEIIREKEAERPRTPIVALTSLDDEDIRVSSSDVGVDEFISKPYESQKGDTQLFKDLEKAIINNLGPGNINPQREGMHSHPGNDQFFGPLDIPLPHGLSLFLPFNIRNQENPGEVNFI